MRLADDERGRVPFALVGIVLLVASAALTVGMQPDRPASEPPVDVVMDRATASTTTELRTAVVTAGDAAAREPVLSRSNTTAGRVLDEDDTFRDWLRVRIYLQARDRLADHEIEQQGVTATASLPPTPNASALRDAKRRVHIEPVGDNETKLEVHVENVTITARRGNRTVGREQVSPTLTVRTPVMALHDGVQEFETRLDRGLDKPGLSQRLTGRLYALTWARGYAQYGSGGGAITNVLANRHVALMTNGALLREQRTAFGRSDATGRRALSEAMVDVGLSDLVAESPVEGKWVDRVFPSGPPGANVPQRIERYSQGSEVPDPGEEMRVGVNETADRAFANAADSSNLTSVLQSVYSVDVKPVADVEKISGDPVNCRHTRPEGLWFFNGSTGTGRNAAFETVSASVPDTGSNWHVVDSAGRTVRLNVTTTCHWVSEEATTTTTATETNRFRVDMALVGRHAHSEYAPERPITDIENGGRFGGLDLSNLHDRADSQVVDGRGGWNGLAERAANNDLDTSPTAIEADVPDGLRRQAIGDIVDLRSSVRNTSVTVQRGRAGTFQANPAGELRRKLADERLGLISASGEYRTVGQKARVAARGSYVRETRELLRDRRDDRWERRDNLTSVLETVGASKDLVENALTERQGVGRTDDAGIDGVEVTAVDGSPPYLTTAEVGDEYVEPLSDETSVYPLAARNVNVFTNPHGDLTDTLLGAVGLGEKVGFRTAAQTLYGLDAATAVTDEGDLGRNLTAQRAELRPAVDGKLQVVEEQYLRNALRESNVGESRSDRLATIEDGLAEWDTTAGKALAVTNGSAAVAIATEAVDDNETKRAIARSNLQMQSMQATSAKETRIAHGKVNESAALMRQELAGKLNDRVKAAMKNGTNEAADRIENRLGKSMNRVPAGLPLVPIGTPWWATTNLWYVEVKGGYDRFAVRAETGGADAPGNSLTYVRDGSVARLDFDGDGADEAFGRAERVSFSARTAVAIVVPPGAQGVGDKDGNMDERSAGWSNWDGVEMDEGDGSERPVPSRWPERDAE
ncbi:DUF7286 family protein [Halorientalis salina]|uniref:DUF7286 family protein n=1 Tax=Halorientalis salina TaxID=2932266 RepID=UPI0010ABE148|nr:hypothetical protein [Halorientalis salina]